MYERLAFNVEFESGLTVMFNSSRSYNLLHFIPARKASQIHMRNLLSQTFSLGKLHVPFFSLSGPSVVKHHLPQLLALWSSAFPKTVKEFEQEKARGDAYTWHVTLEFHAGTLCCTLYFA